ncbi:uncharacterized protein LOC133175449 [Saccostrea echinata]|uniref:uncharacterized protein LOC133175449 n=1 Tax=Saccostrea echinata TaxID=191078 RepID=UPI002A7F5617|nr:uncharacterized protein LOC133175449 [Saccostrea echinata]
MEGSKVLFIALVILIWASILQLIGLASPYWISDENSIDLESSSSPRYAGLWKTCKCRDTGDFLKNFDISKHQLRFAQAMSILGFSALVFASVLTILKLCFLKHVKPVLIVASISAFVGAASIIVSIGLFANDVNNKKLYRYEYHFAFAFCILAMLVAMVSGGFMILEIP